MNLNQIIKNLKKENLADDIIYRRKKINGKDITIIFNESIVSSNAISDFVIRSLDKINDDNLFENITNNIASFKWIEINSYQDLCFYLHFGYTIILIHQENKIIGLETKGQLERSISTPDTESSIRGSKDAFIENLQANIGLVRKRIKSNDLKINKFFIGKYTNTQTAVLSIKSICKKKLVNLVLKQLKKINIDGIVAGEQIKNLIENSNFPLPTILTTERPDIASNALLQGKVVILVDNSPYALIIPGLFYDYFKTPEDFYSKNFNTTFTRIIRYLAFFVALLTPALYLSLITYNQEIIPTELLVNFTTQRDGVPFPAFFEAFAMLIAFEILREGDIRVPSSLGSSLSIVGALILGDAAVAAGIVSPIMIIVIAITSISSLPFTEVDITNALRLYRIFFMIGASFLGLIGIVLVFLIFLINMTSKDIFDIPYLVPYSPFSKNAIKDSIIKFKIKKDNKRNEYLSNNIIKERSDLND